MYFLPVTVKLLETFLEAILWKPFQLFRHIHNSVNSINQALSNRRWFHSRKQVTITWIQQVFQCFYLDQNRPVCWNIIVKGKPIVGAPFFGAFPSDRIPKATNQRMRQKFSSCSNSCKLYQRNPGTLWNYNINLMRDSSLAFQSIGPLVRDLLDNNQGSYKSDDPLGVSCSVAEITNFLFVCTDVTVYF